MMAPRVSKRSFRLRLDRQINQEELNALVQQILQADKKLAKAQAGTQLKTSLALDSDGSTCTITFPEQSSKELAQAVLRKNTFSGWLVDSEFSGVTVLHAPQNADIDICAIHGLGGNATNSFQAEKALWLRDLLATTPPFQSARIMTFGYNSTLFDKSSTDRLLDWANFLLSKLEDFRTAPEASNRPIILVCHSLGGIVARKAIILLNNFPNKFKGISITNCALLFLSTPHSGSAEADYPKFLTSVLESVTGLRNDAIVKELQSFNSSSVEDIEVFQHMANIPPFECLCEGTKTKILGKGECELVTQASAGFLSKIAYKIPHVDHHRVCKYNTKYDDGFREALKRLISLRAELLAKRAPVAGQQNPPGHPEATAFRFPLPSMRKWYEGGLIKSPSSLFVGRSDLMSSLLAGLAQEPSGSSRNIIALTGMGGIGKTALLVEVASRCKDIHHVFACHARSDSCFEAEIHALASSVGPDILSTRLYPVSEWASIWRGMSRSERVAAFSDWLNRGSSDHTLFLIDDIDAIHDPAEMTNALSYQANTVIYTGRNPYAFPTKQKKEEEVPLLNSEETVFLLKRTIEQSSRSSRRIIASEQDLTAVAEILQGHPLAACNAVYFMTQVLSYAVRTPSPIKRFIEMFSLDQWELRKDFLEFKPHSGVSVMESFELSLQRIQEEQSLSSRILQIAAFLTNEILDFREFFLVSRPWIVEFQDEIPNHSLFTIGEATLAKCLRSLEGTSSIMNSSSVDKLHLHPVWVECLRQRVKHPGRLRILSQITLLIRVSLARNEDVELMTRFLDNCQSTAQAFRISEQELEPSPPVCQRLESIRQAYAGLAQTKC